jgi:glucose/arabinose dehydrogenase
MRTSGGSEGRILRLNPDGTTPSDQLSGSPVYAAADGEARGLDWNPHSGELWVAHGDEQGISRVRAVANDRRLARTGTPGHEYPLASAIGVSAIAFYRGDLISPLQDTLLIAAENGLHFARFDPQDPSRISSMDSFIDTPIRAVIAAPDGQLLLLATPDAVLRVRPH